MCHKVWAFGSALSLCSKPRARHRFAHFILTQVCGVGTTIFSIMAQSREVTWPRSPNVRAAGLGFEHRQAGS